MYGDQVGLPAFVLNAQSSWTSSRNIMMFRLISSIPHETCPPASNCHCLSPTTFSFKSSSLWLSQLLHRFSVYMSHSSFTTTAATPLTLPFAAEAQFAPKFGTCSTGYEVQVLFICIRVHVNVLCTLQLSCAVAHSSQRRVCGEELLSWPPALRGFATGCRSQ